MTRAMAGTTGTMALAGSLYVASRERFVNTIRGHRSSGWRRNAGGVTLRVWIPVNSRAGKSKGGVGVPGLSTARNRGEFVTFEVGSGSDAFLTAGGRP